MQNYPNLELLEYKFSQVLRNNSIILERINFERINFFTFKAFVFPQTWHNTATGFDLNGGVSGQAFTDEYTTIFKLMPWRKNQDSIFGVFFGKNLAYIAINPNEQFFTDMKNRNMDSQRWAHKYKSENGNVIFLDV